MGWPLVSLSCCAAPVSYGERFVGYCSWLYGYREDLGTSGI